MLRSNKDGAPPVESFETPEHSLESHITAAITKLRDNGQFSPALSNLTPVIDWQPQIDFETIEKAGRIAPLSQFHRRQIADCLRRYVHNSTGAVECPAEAGSRTDTRALFRRAIGDLERLIKTLNKIAASQWKAPELAQEISMTMQIELGANDLRAAIDTYTRVGSDPFVQTEGPEISPGYLIRLLGALLFACSRTGKAGSPSRNWPLRQFAKELGETFESVGGTMAAKYDDEKGQMSEGPFIRFVAAVLKAAPGTPPRNHEIAKATTALINSRPNFPGDYCDGPLAKKPIFGAKYHECGGKNCACKKVKWRTEMRDERAEREDDATHY